MFRYSVCLECFGINSNLRLLPHGHEGGRAVHQRLGHGGPEAAYSTGELRGVWFGWGGKGGG